MVLCILSLQVVDLNHSHLVRKVMYNYFLTFIQMRFIARLRNANYSLMVAVPAGTLIQKRI